MNQEECRQMASEAEAAYNGENRLYGEGLENLGWEFCKIFYEVHCGLKVELQETEEEKLSRLFNEFHILLRNDLRSTPETLGNIFEDVEDVEDYEAKRTRYDDAVKKFGEDKVFKMLLHEIPSTLTCSFEDEVAATYPAFVVAASLPNSNSSIIYQLLREHPDACDNLERICDRIDNKS